MLEGGQSFFTTSERSYSFFKVGVWLIGYGYILRNTTYDVTSITTTYLENVWLPRQNLAPFPSLRPCVTSTCDARTKVCWDYDWVNYIGYYNYNSPGYLSILHSIALSNHHSAFILCRVTHRGYLTNREYPLPESSHTCHSTIKFTFHGFHHHVT